MTPDVMNVRVHYASASQANEWAGNDRTEEMGERECVDDNACLKSKPGWASFTCPSGLRWCDSYAEDMACCPLTCGKCATTKARQYMPTTRNITTTTTVL